MELLLLSNSTNYGGTMFSHAAETFAEVSAGDKVTFVPYALADWDDYADRAAAALGAFGVEVVSAHRSSANTEQPTGLIRTVRSWMRT